MTIFLLLTFLICLIHKIEFIGNVFTYGLQKKTYIYNVDLYSIVIHWLNNILSSSSLALSFTYIGILKCPHSFLHSFTPSLIHSILSIYYIPRHWVKEKEEEVRGWEQRHRGTRGRSRLKRLPILKELVAIP